MSLLDDLLQAGGGGAVQQVAQRFGLDESQATSAISALLPALQGGVRSNMQQQGGLEGLLGALSSGGADQFMQDPSMLSSPAATDTGNNILGQLLGSKDVSRQVAADASSQTGIGSDVLKQMLPVVATMLMGGLSQKAGQSNLTGMQSSGSGDVMGTLSSFLDADKDGSVVDDIMGMAQKFMQK